MSGSQYKKKRLKKEEQGRKQSYVMKKLLVQKSCLDEPPTSTSTATALDLANKNSVPLQSLPEEVVEESQTITPSEVHQESGSSSIGSQQILNEIPSDPALWNAFCMSIETRQILVEGGPHQIKEFEFPINKGKRGFSPSHYLKVLSNGEVVERKIPTLNQGMALVVDDWLNKFRKLALNIPASDLYRKQINILLCGPPLHGKSSTGNSILGSKEFTVSSDGDTETTTVQLKSTMYEQYKVKVVDCPPAPKEKPTNARKVLKLCGSVMPILLKLCPKGFHAAVIVLQYGSLYYEEEEFVMAMLKEMFGERFIQDHCICIITNGDMFRKVMGRSGSKISPQGLNHWCTSQDPTSVLGRIFRACEYRCVLFDNCTNEKNIKKEQVRQLMSMIVDSWPTTYLLSLVSVNPNIRIEADIHIMIETASSLDEYQYQLKFVLNYTSCYKMSSDTARVCVMIFGEDDERVRFDFSAIETHEKLAEALQRAPFLKKSSGTDKALTWAIQESFSESGNTRQGVQQMALMLTDGHSTDERKSIEEADKLKSSGAEIIVVGAGSVDRKTLEAIASEPTSVYIADTYDELEDLPKEVAQKTAEKAPEFKSTADILFILDSSGSISSADYQKELDFVVHLTECFNIGPNDVLFSVMVFSSDCKVLFGFTLTNHQQVMMQIKAAPHMKRGTNTAAALDLARTETFTTRCGCRGGKKIAIIITDGCSHNMYETARAAYELIDSGVLTLAVGVGNVNQIELEYIATIPKEVCMVGSYRVLETIQDELAKKTCKLETAKSDPTMRKTLPNKPRENDRSII